ncbi:MAG: hypothetical protein RBT69_01435 [Spirochaetia bacterium]|jgi:hypothetical protein|nr:hypothetical protein [Spirochaetia bacterium]
MGKITQQARKDYTEHITKYKQIMEEIVKKENSFNSDLKTGKIKEKKEYKKIEIADNVLNLSSYYILLNSLSSNLLGVKNENFLNEARKSVYRALIYLESVVTDETDIPFSELAESLEKISELSDEKRFEIVKKLGFTIEMIKDAFGENSKWKWSFVELEGRFATVAKNLLNYKTLVSGMDPTAEGYELRVYHLNLVKKMLMLAATRYREKYELNTFRIDDFKLALGYLSALRRIHVYLGETNDSETVKKNLEIWKNKMEKDSSKSI